MKEMTITEMKKWQENIVETLKDQISRYSKGDESHFAHAFYITENIHTALCSIPRQYPRLEPSKEQKSMMFSILITLQDREPKESCIFNCIYCNCNVLEKTTTAIVHGWELKERCCCKNSLSTLQHLKNHCSS